MDFDKELEGLAQYEVDALREAESSGGGVRLPFPALFAHVKNGDQRMRGVVKDQPSLYFGGWEADGDQLAELIQSGVVSELPAAWATYEGSSGQKTWNAIGTRKLIVSYIAKRESWVDKEGQSRKPKYDPQHSRRHLQVLVSLYANGGYYCPAVLTAKGFQAGFVLEALQAWDKAIAPLKKEINATALPRSAFWLEIGTDGEKPEFREVGNSATSIVTPMIACGVAELTAEKLKKRYVGKDVLANNIKMLAEASEWLKAWSEPEAKKDDGYLVSPEEERIEF